jgi:Protein kinase domain
MHPTAETPSTRESLDDRRLGADSRGFEKGALRLVVGETVLGNRYRLVDRIGKGGMGVVWRAYDEVLDRRVAVKVLAADFVKDADFRHRVLAEARAAGRLNHPHIAAVYDYGESTTDSGDPVPYLVMELLNGPSLEQRLSRGSTFTVEQALGICAEVASALAAGHAHGLVHRDVKPGNVMLTPRGAKVVDFGLAAVAGELEDHGPIMLGTPAYLAPERLSGHPVVAATDVYALGLLLYRLLAGRLPWTAETTTQMLDAHVYQEPEPLPRLAGVPPVVSDLIRRCLAKEPEKRPPSSEMTVTLAQAAGIRVPLDGVTDDDDDVDADGTPTPVSIEKARANTPTVRHDRLADMPARAMSATGPYAARLDKHLDASLDHVNLRRQASLLLRGAVDFHLAIWAVLDPMTLMWASCVVDGEQYNERFEHLLFANEYGQDDVLKLADLADGARIGTLHFSTSGNPGESRRFRQILQPRGFSDELRQTFYDTAGTWGALLLYRKDGQFTEADVAQLAPAGRPLGAALRHALVRKDWDSDPTVDVSGKITPQPSPVQPAPNPVPERVPEPADERDAGYQPQTEDKTFKFPKPRSRWIRRERRPPLVDAPTPHVAEPPRADQIPRAAPPAEPPHPAAGTLTMSYEGRLVDVTADARAVLDTTELDKVGMAVARGRMAGLVDRPRGKSHDGRWLAFCATPEDAGLSVTVQRIRPYQVSELVASAYRLEPWQWRLLGGLARGRDTRQIAQDLNKPVWVVQEGVESLFGAFRAQGRLAFIKTLFFDHYVPLHATDVTVEPPLKRDAGEASG